MPLYRKGRIPRGCVTVLTGGCAALSVVHPSQGQAVMVQHTEAVQVIQNSKGDVPLIEGKRTGVRVFLSSSGTRPVRGVLRMRRSDGSTSSYQSIAPANPIVGPFDLGTLRRKSGTSLNFLIPAEDVQSGSANLEVASLSDASTGVPVTCTNCPRTRNVVFQPGPTLRLVLVSYRYRSGGQTIVPRDTDLFAAEEWIRRTFPVRDRLIVNRRVIDAASGSLTCNMVNAHVGKIRESDMAHHADPRTHYLALVSDAALPDFWGCATYNPYKPDPKAIATAPAGKFEQRWDWDTDGSYADWYSGHELGHLLGRSHLGACGDEPKDIDYPYDSAEINKGATDFVGWDIDSATPHGDKATHDVMSYCSNLWPSAYTYDLWYDRLLEESTIPAQPKFLPITSMMGALNGLQEPAAPPGNFVPPAELAVADTTRWVAVLGALDFANLTGELQAVVEGAPGASRSLDPPDSVRLRTRDAAGEVVDSFPVHVQIPTAQDEKGVTIATFREDIVLDARATVVELVMHEKVVDSVRVSRSAPKLSNLTIKPGLRDDTHPLVFTWNAVDPDNAGQLSYTVLVWFDNNEVPETLAVELRTPRIAIDSSQRMGRLVTKIEVVASDGVHVNRIQATVPP